MAEPQGIAYVPSSDSVFVANAGDGSVRVLRGEDLAPIGRIELGDDADNVRLDAPRKQVLVGYTVRLKSLGRDGRVLRYFDDDSFEIAVGPMKMKVARDDIATVVAHASGSPVEAARSRGINVSLAREDDSVATEINVIGHTVDDATREVEKFVDRAFLADCGTLKASLWRF